MRAGTLRGMVVAGTLVLAGLAGGGWRTQAGAAGDGPRSIEIAICLDVSGTMEKLLEAARVDIWDLVARLAAEDPEATLRVAVLTYGNTFAGEAAGWVRIEAPLSSDLDMVSARLFGVRIAGDTEYVARVVRTAAEELDWDPSPETRRMIVVLGNESANQDPRQTLEDAARAAADREIDVSAVYCGRANPAEQVTWAQFASLAGTNLAFFDPALGVHAEPTPFDKDLAALGDALSGTYVPIGDAGSEAKSLQDTQDRKVSSLGPAAAALRAEAKASALYGGGGWDLVAAVESGRVAIEDVPESDLPEPLRAMSVAERARRIEEIAAERQRIRQEITDLAGRRRGYLEARGKPAGGAGLSDLIMKKIQH